MWRGCSRRCRPEVGYELLCASRVRRRGWISGPAGDESTDRFHAIDSRPAWCTDPEAGGWSPAFAVDLDCASGLVSSLVISVSSSGDRPLGVMLQLSQTSTIWLQGPG